MSVVSIQSLLGFRGALWQLVQRWTRQEEYSHGFLIVVVAAGLLWTRRHEGIFAF
jgi:Transmembrane exosortase (Exosortase_EpsH)